MADTKKAKILSEKTVHDGYNRLCVYDLQAPSQNPEKRYGKPVNREVLHSPDSVIVLIHAKDIDSFVICREFRTGVFFNEGDDNPFMYQCVAGSMDKEGKSSADIARMETREEAGVEPESLEYLGMAYASPGRTTEKTYFYVAEVSGAPQAGTHGLPEEGEEITTHVIKCEEVYQMIDGGKIIDSMTLLALLLFRQKNVS